MISKKELNSIDEHYFNVIHKGCYAIYLQSKNTKHFWGIIEEKYPTFRHFQIYHKHNHNDEYHRHRDRSNLNKAITSIKEHDVFQLNGRK